MLLHVSSISAAPCSQSTLASELQHAQEERNVEVELMNRPTAITDMQNKRSRLATGAPVGGTASRGDAN
eukprot:6182202-Pleurochrysis_carterae.AAC.2